jgi:hypothetical protein
MVKAVFYIPKGIKDAEEVKEIEKILERFKPSSILKISKEIMDEADEEKVKELILFPAVYKRIKIRQTRRTKSLYSQLVIFENDRAITFYPQSRGRDEITIQDFLEGLLRNEVKCLHDRQEIESKIKGSK